MFSHDDLISVHSFLKTTGEGHLRKMLVNGKMTDAHLRVLLKVARGCSESQFIEHLEKETLPKMNLSAAESAVRETFWSVCLQALTGVGLLSAARKSA